MNDIKDILKTIFTYVEPNSKLAKKVRDNFLLVEYEEGIQNSIIEDHDIELNDQLTIRINKIKTNNFIEIYRSIANLKLPMSVMEIRKFEFINRDIKLGDSIKVRFAEDLDKLQNSDMVIAIGSLNTVRVEYKLETINDMIKNYFKIIEDRNDQLIKLINNQKISRDQYFPIYAFSKIYDKITTASALKEQQASKIKKIIDNIHKYSKDDITSIGSIISSNDICKSYKTEAIVWGIYKDRLNLDEVKQYLENNKNNSKDTDYRKILCA